MSEATAGAGLRADARRNREAIVRAASRVFAARGVAAPLRDVAAEAGVGRGTLFRHFPQRLDLVLSVYEEAMAGDEAFVAERVNDPDAALLLIDRITARQTSMAGFLSLLRSAPDGDGAVGELRARTRGLIQTCLPHAHAAGALPLDVGADDLLLVPAMMEGLLASLGAAEVPAARLRLFELLRFGPGRAVSRPAVARPRRR